MYPRLTEEAGAIELAARIRARALSPSEAVDAAIGRIERLDGAINAVVVRDFERARIAARAQTQAGPRDDQPLFGVPMTVKESFDVAGLPTTWGLESARGNIAAEDAVVVERLKRAGAVILGKTNVPPMLADWQATNPVYGRTVNPHDPTRSPGGSSGGSAAALALGMVPAEFGSDIGGSIRVPSHFSGVWGHKTTWGVVSSAGQHPPGSDGHDPALGVVGPLARTGEDLALLLEVTLDHPLASRAKPLRECRFLHLEDHPLCPAEGGVKAAIEAAVVAMEGAGATVDRRSDRLPDLIAQHASYLPMLQIAMAQGGPGPDGQVASAARWFELCDEQARSQRAWAALFCEYDFVLAPIAAVPAFAHDERPIAQRTLDVDGAPFPAANAVLAYAGLATFPGLPATALPVGSAGHLPVGLQVIGSRYRDRDCIATATAIGALLS
jgi:amidase